jgi:hypothetical protein
MSVRNVEGTKAPAVMADASSRAAAFERFIVCNLTRGSGAGRK